MVAVKVCVGSAVIAISGISLIILETGTNVGIPPQWIIGILVTVLIAVLTAMGTVVKIAYDTAKKWETVLGGDEQIEESGFINETKSQHEELKNHQEQVYEQLLIQGQLLSELTYAFADIAEELDEQEDANVDINLDRIERLRKRKDRTREQSDVESD